MEKLTEFALLLLVAFLIWQLSDIAYRLNQIISILRARDGGN